MTSDSVLSRPRRQRLGYVLPRSITESPNANQYQKPLGLARAFDVLLLAPQDAHVPREILDRVRAVRVRSRFGQPPLSHLGSFQFVLAAIRKLIQVTSRNGVDAVCTGIDQGSLVIGSFARAFLRIPWVAFCWDHPCPVQAERRDMLSRFIGAVRLAGLRVLIRYGSILCCNIHPGLWRELGHLPVRTSTFPNGTDARRIRRCANSSPVDQRLIGVIANVNEKKGASLAVEALHLVRRHFPDARLRFVGETDPKFMPEFEARILSLGLLPAVEIIGWQPYGLAMRSAAQCCMGLYAYRPLPRFYWNYVLKIGEYSALGKPVVSVDTPGARQYIRDGYNGFLVEPENPEAMATAICKLLGNPELCDRMARNARLSAQRYCWDKVHDRMNRVISSLLWNKGC